MPLIDVVTASTDYDLTTTGAVRLYRGTTSTDFDSENPSLAAAIRSASRWAESVVGYPLSRQTYREIVPGWGMRSLIMARQPIMAVAALWDSTSTDTAARVFTSELQVQRNAGLIRRPAGFVWSVTNEPWLTPRPLPGQEIPSWLVDYAAGYTYNGLSTDSPNWSTEAGTTSTGRTLPEDIEMAVIMKAVDLADGTDELVQEEVGDLRLRYAGLGANADKLDPATALLTPYRRVM
jgi:hypothetical protein